MRQDRPVMFKWGPIIVVALLVAMGTCVASAQSPIDNLLRPTVTVQEEKDLWIGGEIGLTFHPRFMLGGRFDMGVGLRHNGFLIAGNLKVGFAYPAWFAVDLLLNIGGTQPGRATQPFYALQAGGGLVVDSPKYALRPSSVPVEWVTEAVSPCVIVGGSFGMFVGSMEETTQFRVALEPRFRGVFSQHVEGSAFMPVAELALVLGADVI